MKGKGWSAFGDREVTTKDLRDWDLTLGQQDALLDEIDRLRALVKQAERDGRQESEPADICPWCHFVRGLQGVEFKNTHSADCPAFTSDGEVR